MSSLKRLTIKSNQSIQVDWFYKAYYFILLCIKRSSHAKCRTDVRRPLFPPTLLYLLLTLSNTQNLYAQAVNYLYINASEGTASGGHTALRFGKETYHFQRFPNGIIRLVKQVSRDFDFQYRYLENRTLYQTRIELNTEQYKQLRDHFNLHFLRQKQQDNLLQEVKLNLALLAPNSTDFKTRITVRGAGLFVLKTNSSKATEFYSQEINTRIKDRLDSTFLKAKISQLEQNIVKIKPQPWPDNALHLSKSTFISVPYSFAQQYISAVSQLLFLQVLENNAPLNKASYFSPEHQLFLLSEGEIKKIIQLQSLLIENLLSLLNSTRPDSGNAALILYARIISLSYSIKSGRWIFLDTYADNSPHITYAEVASYKAAFKAQQQAALHSIADIKQQLFSQQTITEKAYSHFERLSNYYYERERGLNKQHGMRTSGEQHLPSKAAPLPTYLLPKLNSQEIETAKTRLIHYQTNLVQQMQALYPYDLLTHNCVTEIFATIRNAQVDAGPLANLLNMIHKDPVAFIPYLSFADIAKHHNPQVFTSFRTQQLEKMYAQENNLYVYLREFNTVSARDYKYNELDAPFLFFTHDQIWSRPLLGTFNLIMAGSIGIYGSLTWPYDAGKNLKKGAMGILMSLPELAFFNIRKGTYKYLAFPVNPE